MIGGYILPTRNQEFEILCRQRSTAPLDEYILNDGACVAWFFRTKVSDYSKNDSYSNNDNILILEGLAVVGIGEDGYRLFNPGFDLKPDEDDAYYRCIDGIVSDVNSIYLSRKQGHLDLSFASNRISGGRIWYSQTTGKKGIYVCSDYRILTAVNDYSVEPMAVFSILKYGICPDPFTIFKNIYSVPAARIAHYDSISNKIEVKPYYLFDFPESNGCNLEPIKQTLINEARFLSSTCQGMLLSGGVDSTLFAHYLGQISHIQAYFIAAGNDDPEILFAKEAARSAKIPLAVIFPDEKDVLSTIIKAPLSYLHPFANYGTIATYYLMEFIKKQDSNTKTLITGTGADICFGTIGKRDRSLLRLAKRIPKILRYISEDLYNGLALYNSRSKMAYGVGFIANSQTNPLFIEYISCQIDSLFNREAQALLPHVDSTFIAEFMPIINAKPHNSTLGADIATSNYFMARATSLKDLNVGPEPVLKITYPYMWKDILNEQGKLSWRCKNNNGVTKWPIKHILEEFMSHEFIYRRKSGLNSPLSQWIHQKDIYSLIRDTLLNPNAQISPVLSKKHVKNLIDTLPNHKSVSESVLNFIWGALFTELWLQDNHRLPIDKARFNSPAVSQPSAQAIFQDCHREIS